MGELGHLSGIYTERFRAAFLSALPEFVKEIVAEDGGDKEVFAAYVAAHEARAKKGGGALLCATSRCSHRSYRAHTHRGLLEPMAALHLKHVL